MPAITVLNHMHNQLVLIRSWLKLFAHSGLSQSGSMFCCYILAMGAIKRCTFSWCRCRGKMHAITPAIPPLMFFLICILWPGFYVRPSTAGQLRHVVVLRRGEIHTGNRTLQKLSLGHAPSIMTPSALHECVVFGANFWKTPLKTGSICCTYSCGCVDLVQTVGANL
jgi:hypothetical protein